MNLSRKYLGWLIATRSGHDHFADYHEKFGGEEEATSPIFAPTQDQTELDYFVLEIKGHFLRDNPGCKNVCRMGSKNGATSERKGT